MVTADVRQTEPKDNRLTKLQRTRRAWDFIVAAHYYYGGTETGYRSIAKLFDMPTPTIRNIISRTHRNDPGVKHAALRFGLIRVDIGHINNKKLEL